MSRRYINCHYYYYYYYYYYWIYGFSDAIWKFECPNRSQFARQAVLESGPEYENARCPILRRRSGRSYLLLADEQSRISAVDERVSIMQRGLRPVWVLCIIRHSVKIIRYLIGSQWSSHRDEVTWSRGQSPLTKRTAALWTRCSGAMVDCVRPIRSTLQ